MRKTLIILGNLLIRLVFTKSNLNPDTLDLLRFLNIPQRKQTLPLHLLNLNHKHLDLLSHGLNTILLLLQLGLPGPNSLFKPPNFNIFFLQIFLQAHVPFPIELYIFKEATYFILLLLEVFLFLLKQLGLVRGQL